MKQYSPKIIERSPSSAVALTEIGHYLIKLYVHNHESLLGTFVHGKFELSGAGRIASDEWVRSASAYTGISIDAWRVLPDCLEGVVNVREISRAERYSGHGKKPRLLSSFIASYKAAAAKRINLLNNTPGTTIWQRNYQERHIPDQVALEHIIQMLGRPS